MHKPQHRTKTRQYWSCCHKTAICLPRTIVTCRVLCWAEVGVPGLAGAWQSGENCSHHCSGRNQLLLELVAPDGATEQCSARRQYQQAGALEIQHSDAARVWVTPKLFLQNHGGRFMISLVRLMPPTDRDLSRCSVRTRKRGYLYYFMTFR